MSLPGTDTTYKELKPEEAYKTYREEQRTDTTYKELKQALAFFIIGDLLRTDTTYKELKLSFSLGFVAVLGVLILPIRNWNLCIMTAPTLAKLGTDTTYKELKLK